MKGIILAAGRGTRMYPMTKPVCKPLLPVYDKPMIDYPLSTLIMAGIREILVIVPPGEISVFARLLGDGSAFGIRLDYLEQPVQRGIADAFLIGADFIGSDPVCLALGDNIFWGHGFADALKSAMELRHGAVIFGCRVEDPRPFGVVEFDEQGRVVSIEEKPAVPRSHYIVPGLYFYDNRVVSIARTLTPSERGELEITAVNNAYLEAGELRVIPLDQQIVWYDAGSAESLWTASDTIRRLQRENDCMIGCPEEQAFERGFLSADQLRRLGASLSKTQYGQYLLRLADRSDRR